MEYTNIALERPAASGKSKTLIKKIPLSSLLLLFTGVVLILEKTLTTKASEPFVMLLAGTALIAISSILRRVTVER